MILRTPPPRKRRADSELRESPPDSNRGLVIYEDPPASVPDSAYDPPEQMLCTYQCRQMVKSDFLDTFSSNETLLREYESKLQTMNEDLCKTEAERKKYHDQFLYAEQELAAARGREQALQDQLLKEVNESQEQLRKQMHLYNELEVKFQKEMNMRKTAESSAASAVERANLLETQHSHLSGVTEREDKRVQEELLQLKEESKLSVSRIRADLEIMECKAHHAEKESALLKEQLEELRKQLSESLQQRNELEKKLTSFTASQDPSSTVSSVLVKHLQEELRSYESEVLQARKLKTSHENIELLKEKLMEEKGHRERAEAKLLKLPELQLSMKKLEDELLSWKKLAEDIPWVSKPEDIPLKFAALQKDMIESEIKLGEVNARLKQIEVALESAELSKQNAEAEASVTKEKAELVGLEVKHLESKLSLAIEEIDQLRNAFTGLKKQNKDDTGDEMSNGSLIKELESSLARKDCYIKELETTLHEQRDTNNRQFTEIGLLNEKLNGEAKRVKSLEREADRLRSEISLLELKLGHGDYSSANTKVLRMVNALGVDNEARQTIEALQSELQKANEKLQVVEELKKQSADAGELVESYISGKILHLKEQIATLEKREERYKTVFADKISVFRRACCELFGYKIVMDDQQRPNGIPITRFTLQSIYAQSDDEKLEFEYESGNTNILVNDYTSQHEISQQVEIFIRKLNSIPAFTANLTVESFNRQTLS
ncbi:hypothetical protein Nepgr_027506 [Nepenthes gracilis]|uniref:Mitotic spindle checkpoint protein MAD1 n=1 Tax=Nepenthes gracilis TaxID=150966 RepID=A0AAD3Y1I1_NEPGR|nr:hypothetical protein Nepgr_027506 [Nepenthes gracilis]